MWARQEQVCHTEHRLDKSKAHQRRVGPRAQQTIGNPGYKALGHVTLKCDDRGKVKPCFEPDGSPPLALL